jgi:3-dehydroquinate synthase
VVAADEREGGLRAILNFGHTFGHAIEAGQGYGAWLHGEAVACGMVLAAEVSVRLGLAQPGLVPRLKALLTRCGLPVVAPRMPLDQWLALMRVDKKAEGGEIRFVLIDGPGRCVVRPAPDALVTQVIAAHTAA